MIGGGFQMVLDGGMIPYITEIHDCFMFMFVFVLLKNIVVVLLFVVEVGSVFPQ